MIVWTTAFVVSAATCEWVMALLVSAVTLFLLVHDVRRERRRERHRRGG